MDLYQAHIEGTVCIVSSSGWSTCFKVPNLRRNCCKIADLSRIAEGINLLRTDIFARFPM